MRPLGRKTYNSKTGAKHITRIEGGKKDAWWFDIIQPNKRAEHQEAQHQIDLDIEEYEDDVKNE